MSDSNQPKGILRNSLTHDYSHVKDAEYDRKVVLENTKKNALLHSQTDMTKEEKLREKLQREKRLHEEGVQFNDRNLQENEKLKNSMVFTKIDEPKTPYQGPINENNDYYRSDNEEDDFSLGAGEDEDEETEQPEEDSNNITGSRIQLSKEELKHQKFEDLRKKHYHNEVDPSQLKKVLSAQVVDDEEED